MTQFHAIHGPKNIQSVAYNGLQYFERLSMVPLLRDLRSYSKFPLVN